MSFFVVVVLFFNFRTLNRSNKTPKCDLCSPFQTHSRCEQTFNDGQIPWFLFPVSNNITTLSFLHGNEMMSMTKTCYSLSRPFILQLQPKWSMLLEQFQMTFSSEEREVPRLAVSCVIMSKTTNGRVVELLRMRQLWWLGQLLRDLKEELKQWSNWI